MHAVANESFGVEIQTEWLEPLGDAVLVQRLGVESKTKAGLALPESVQATQRRRQPRGLVVAVGPGRDLEDGTQRKMRVKVGDIIIVGDGAGMNHVKLEGASDDLYIIDCDGILGIVRQEQV